MMFVDRDGHPMGSPYKEGMMRLSEWGIDKYTDGYFRGGKYYSRRDMMNHVAQLEEEIKKIEINTDAYADENDVLKEDRDRIRDDLNAMYEWLAVEFPRAFASLKLKVLNPDALLTEEDKC